uniref:Uncharacterized protein n=1 Tax=Populus trichocarpa TaxID=3694 RepID=U5G843_POPTR
METSIHDRAPKLINTTDSTLEFVKLLFCILSHENEIWHVLLTFSYLIPFKICAKTTLDVLLKQDSDGRLILCAVFIHFCNENI